MVVSIEMELDTKVKCLTVNVVFKTTIVQVLRNVVQTIANLGLPSERQSMYWTIVKPISPWQLLFLS